MITEVVLFDLPAGTTRAAMIAQFKDSIARWRDDPDLLRKHMIFDLERGKGGGIYLWPSVEAAKRAHDEGFRQRILKHFGSEPTYQYFETPVIVDNEHRDVQIDAAG
jgi:hypothetical protein